MFFAANYRANDFVLARFGGSGKEKLLLPGLEEQVPTVHSSSILGSQQSEAMDGTIPIPRFRAAGRDPQKHLFARFHRDLGNMLARDLVAAVTVGGELDDMGLRTGARKPDEEATHGREQYKRM